MNNVLYIGFKGKNNTSSSLAESYSEHLLLTNSFTGLKNDIETIEKEYDYIVMLGIDKSLTSSVRIEKIAVKDGVRYESKLNLEKIASFINSAGISATISEKPTAYLCNEAYWYILEKYSGRAVFIHVPTLKHVDKVFFESMKKSMNNIEDMSIKFSRANN